MRTRSAALLLCAAVSVVGVTAVGALAPVAAEDRVIVVQPGDTLSGIAVRVGVPVEVLVAVNGLSNPDHIDVGQRLRLEPATTTSAPATKEKGAATHRVRAGETLSDIALQYGTSVAELTRLNGIADPAYIQAGAVLTVPASGAAPPAAAPRASSTRHRVKPGETLSDIAAEYGTSVAELARLNGIADPAYIQAGAVLTVPAGASPEDSATPLTSLPASIADAAARHESVRRLIVADATRLGVAPSLAMALAWQESGWQTNLVSSAGAIGVMQLLPATGQWIADDILHERLDIRSTGDNVRAGIALLGFYLDRYRGNRSLALAAYYQGMTSVDRHGVYAASWPYVNAILALEARLRG